MSYPIGWKWTSEKEHFLFDFGYSYALLRRCKEELKDLALLDQGAADLVAEINALFKGRQQTTTEVYDAADKVFEQLSHGLDTRQADPGSRKVNEP
jgi:hypothetical protein